MFLIHVYINAFYSLFKSLYITAKLRLYMNKFESLISH